MMILNIEKKPLVSRFILKYISVVRLRHTWSRLPLSWPLCWSSCGLQHRSSLHPWAWGANWPRHRTPLLYAKVIQRHYYFINQFIEIKQSYCNMFYLYDNGKYKIVRWCCVGKLTMKRRLFGVVFTWFYTVCQLLLLSLYVVGDISRGLQRPVIVCQS